MRSAKVERRLYWLLDAVVLIGLAGVILVLFRAQSVELAVFEIMAFSVSVTAVTLAILGAISNIHQRRVMQRMAREMHEAIIEIKDLRKDNEVIQRALEEDSAQFAKEIAEVLAEFGVIADAAKRHAVAGNIEKKVRKRVKNTPQQGK